MDKECLLAEIRRRADENDGRPLGREKFEKDTGISVQEVLVQFGYRKWSEVISDAGLSPNKLRSAFDAMTLVLHLARLTRALGSFPTNIDLRTASRKDPSFPSHNTFRRLGTKMARVGAVLDFCRADPQFADVIPILENSVLVEEGDNADRNGPEREGFVYLLKSGSFYKIGHTNSVERRAREITIQLPEELATVHIIRTDDPSGIEAYWHRRFADKRKNGEWFALSRQDVTAFRRRKFM